MEGHEITTVKDSADIVDIIGGFIDLKRNGTSYKALCPFHSEKTPSFSVSPSRGCFKCFGCGEAGDVIDFVMKHQGLNFTDAVRLLATMHGVTLSEDNKPIDNEAEKVALEFAARFYQKQGAEYFEQRGFKAETIEKFRLGTAPNSWNALRNDARRQGFDDSTLKAAGLLHEKQYDLFRNRAIIPIRTTTGEVVAFGARTLIDEKPKYINSKDSAVYSKTNTLYGLYEAKKAIRSESFAYIVEGYTDVLAMHEAGRENVVSSSGTSLTLQQLALLKRFCSRVVLAFDKDTAGDTATQRSVQLAIKQGFDVDIAILDAGKDPADMPEFKTQSFLVYLSEKAKATAGDDSTALANETKAVFDLLKDIPDEVKREVMHKECAKIFQLETLAPETPSEVETLLADMLNKHEAQQLFDELQRSDKSMFDNTPIIHESVYQNLPSFFNILDGLEDRRRDMAFVFLLGLVSGSLTNVRARHDDDQIPVLFTYVAAPSSSGKNICDKMMPVIRGIHDKRRQLFSEQVKLWESQKRLAKSLGEPFDEPRPTEKKLWQTANMSAAAFNQSLIENNLVVADTEGDTLANVMKQEWGGLSEVFCKVYHQEAVGISRAGKEQIECEAPVASIALSSVDDQIQNVIKEPTSGLLSRFSFYRFTTSERAFKMPQLRAVQITGQEWRRRQRICADILLQLETFEDAVFVLNKKQVVQLNKLGEKLESYIQVLDNDRAFQLVTRGILQVLRIAAILSNLGRYDDLVKDGGELTIPDKYLHAAVKVFRVFFECNVKTFAEISDLQPVKKRGNTSNSMYIFELLPPDFTTGTDSDLQRICEENEIQYNTAKRYVTKWAKKGLIEKIKQGAYKKLTKI